MYLSEGSVLLYKIQKKFFSRFLFFKGKETTDLPKRLSIFEHTFEEYKQIFFLLKL